MSDALAKWWSVRSTFVWPNSPDSQGSLVGVRDGHRHFLDNIVRPRDLTRATRLHAALDRVRADAQSGAALTFDRLSQWHKIAVDATSSEFRRTIAFAKKGQEKYGIDDRTEDKFAACLSEASSSEGSLSARATRAYLDVIFFHPFRDGNARMAALTLDFVLARGGVILDQVGPLFLVSRRADDAAGLAAFVRLLEVLIASTRRRAVVGSTERCTRPLSKIGMESGPIHTEPEPRLPHEVAKHYSPADCAKMPQPALDASVEPPKNTEAPRRLPRGFFAPTQGLEPWTRRLTAACSTN